MKKIVLFTFLSTLSFTLFSQSNITQSTKKEKTLPVSVKNEVEKNKQAVTKLKNKAAKSKKSDSDLTEQQLIEKRKNLGVISDPLKSEEAVLTTPNNN